MDNDKYMLVIPYKIKTEMEIISGYGIKELIKTIIITIVAIVIAYLIYLIRKESLLSVLFVIGCATASVVLFTKNSSNFSLLDYILNIIKFALTQKKYKYCRREDDI